MIDWWLQAGITAIVWAVKIGQDAIFEMLVEKGADLNAIDGVSELLICY